jgi:hypothetical protein
MRGFVSSYLWDTTLAGKKTESVGAGRGSLYGEHTVCEELRAGDFVVRKLPAVALDLSRVSRVMGRPLDGVLGYNFLASRVAQIDYFRRRIRLYRESPFSPTPLPPPTLHRIGFAMKFMEGSVLPVFEDCYVNGTRIPVTIDTGSSLGLILFPRRTGPAGNSAGRDRLPRKGPDHQGLGQVGPFEIDRPWSD